VFALDRVVERQAYADAENEAKAAKRGLWIEMIQLHRGIGGIGND